MSIPRAQTLHRVGEATRSPKKQGQPLNTVTTPWDTHSLTNVPDSNFSLLLPGAREGGGRRRTKKVKKRAKCSLPYGALRYRIISFRSFRQRSYGSQEEEAAEAVVLISFVGLRSRPSGGAGA